MSEGSIKIIGKNIITSSPYTIYQAGILATIVTGDYKYIFFSLLAFLMGDGFNAIEKNIVKNLLSNNKFQKIIQRPDGCGIGKYVENVGERDNWNKLGEQFTGCGIYPGTKKSTTFGMPSGHAQITSFSSTFWSIYVWMKYIHEKDLSKKSKLKNQAIVSTVIMWSLSLVVWTQRVVSGCHSIFQIIIGVVCGIIFGILGYYISSLVLKDMPVIMFNCNNF